MSDPYDIQGRMYVTFRKEKVEFFIHKRPVGTHGPKIAYRRCPADEAISSRISSMLKHMGLVAGNTDIWVLLYPPEVLTTTMYLPAHAGHAQIREKVKDEVLTSIPYFVNYDWQKYLLSVRAISESENMVTVTILGKAVLPRLKELLKEFFGRLSFLGDGLQFLKVDDERLPGGGSANYEVILPYDESHFVAAFHAGVHVESQILTHGMSTHFGAYQLKCGQVYLDLRRSDATHDGPEIQPLADSEIWGDCFLTPSAFPSWYVTENTSMILEPVNFIQAHSDTRRKRSKALKFTLVDQPLR